MARDVTSTESNQVRIRFGARLRALATQKIAPIAMRFQIPLKDLDIASRPVAEPTTLVIPTRHGAVRCLVFRPHPDAPLAGGPDGPPVVLQIHGGAFLIRAPWQDNHINRYLAADVGAVVISPDYRVGPQVQYPVAQEQCYDIAAWLVAHGAERGWDVSRLAVGGTSAGGTLAINVVQQARTEGTFALRAAVFSCAASNNSEVDRIPVIEKPYINPQMIRLVLDTYYVNESRRREPLASPAYDPDLATGMPPVLIMTGGLDTLGPEMDLLAEQLAAAGVEVTHQRYAESDHGFGHFKDLEVAHDSLRRYGAHLRKHLA